MQLKWIRLCGGKYFETEVFRIKYAITPIGPWSSVEGWKILRSVGVENLKKSFETAEEAMVAAHRIIEKELEKGYVRKAEFDSYPAKLSYILEDMWGYKKALALFTNENGDEYIDSVLVSATIPKGSLVREVDPEHHEEVPVNHGICRKCRSNEAVIVDILPPMFVREEESTNLPSRKTQRKKIPIISVHIVQESFYSYTAGRRTVHTNKDECFITRKLISGFMSMILGCDNDARIFGEWLGKITKTPFPVSLNLAIVTRLLDPYKDVVDRYQDDSYMLCKVLLARILRDIGIMDIALRQSYKIGKKIQIDNFDLDNNACGAGFHFFKTAIEAWNYYFN